LKLGISLTAEDLKSIDIKGKAVVAIDIFRATSTILTAFENGCEAVVPVLSVEEARIKKKKFLREGKEVLIAGEREGKKIPGLDLGNSPEEFTRADLAGKVIILTTSNGTRAIRNAEGAEKILIGALMNSGAVAERLAPMGLDVVYACAGRLGDFSLEDFLAAGAITHYLKKINSCLEMTDLLLAATRLFECVKEDLVGFLRPSRNGRYLAQIGFARDIDFCCRLNVNREVPEYKDGFIKNPPLAKNK